MRLAVTGGAGFLGYHLCNKLAGSFEKILVLDLASIDKTEYPSNAEYFRLDVRDIDKLLEILKGTDLIVHAAAALPLWGRKEISDMSGKSLRGTLREW